MAIVLTLLPDDAKITIGKTQKFTAEVTGAPEGATTTYAWTVDGATQQTTENYLNYTPTTDGVKIVKVVATTKSDELEEDDIKEASVNLTVTKNTMTPKVEIKADSTTKKYGDSYTLTCEVTGEPSGSAISYKWDNGKTSSSISETANKVGKIVHECEVTITAKDYTTFVETKSIEITVVKAVMPPIGLTISGPIKGDLNKTVELEAEVSGTLPGSSIQYNWSTGGTEKTTSVNLDSLGSKTISCEVTVSLANYEDSTKTQSHVILVEDPTPKIPEECPLVYVHPLPQRNSAYIWCGWWVMDAIQKMTNEGKDWKTATKDDTPYYCHLNVLAKMIFDYPEVDVQESRHGRIVHRSALDIGIIY